MLKKFISLFVTASLVCSTMLSAAANSVVYSFKKADTLPQADTIYYNPDEEVTFIVELEGDPLLAYSDAATYGSDFLQSRTKKLIEEEIIANQMSVADIIQEEIPGATGPEYVYTALFNGFSIKGKRSDEEKLLSIPGVTNVYISSEFVAAPKLTDSVALAHALPEEISGYTGAGQAIAIIDNEFSTTHEMFSQEPENVKYSFEDIDNLMSGLNMNVKLSADDVYISAKIPFAYDYANKTADTYTSKFTHGTHVAGIAGGNNGDDLSGVAPDAQLVLMRVSNENGGMPDSDIFKAINDAVLLGVCAINCSFGIDYKSADTAPLWKKNIDNAYNAGIYISAAASNSAKGFYEGPVLTENIDYSATAVPATISSATSVASANNSYAVYPISKATLEDGEEVKLMRATANTNLPKLVGSNGIEYVYCGYGLPVDFTSDLSGKIALVTRGNCSFAEKAAYAQAAGAVGIIIINNNDEYITITELPIPSALVTASDGEKLLANCKIIKAPSFTNTKIPVQNIDISSFSSYCVDETLELKPDITAPGGNIYSSIPKTDKYGILSGTSMAAPHITGIVAIMNEYLDEIEYSGEKSRIDYINNLLMSTATVLNYASTDIPYSPRVQGSGLVNAAAALSTPVILYGETGKTKLNLMDNLTNKLQLSFSAENIADFEAVYDSISVDVLTDSHTETNGAYFVDKTKRLNAQVDKPPDSLTVASKTTQNVSIGITLNETELSENLEFFPNGFFIEGFVRLESSQENVPSIGIPFMGFYGDWTKAPVFDKTIYDESGSLLVNKDKKVLGTLLSSEQSAGVFLPLGYGISDSGKLGYVKDFIAISPNGDGVSDNLCLMLTPMRTTKNLTISFLNSAMEPRAIYNISGYENKFYTSVINGLSWIQNRPDGNYYVKVDAQYNYNSDNPTAHSFTLPFYIDTVVPKIVKATLNSNVIHVNGYDNRHINNITVVLPDGSEYISYIPPEAEGKSVHTSLQLDADTVYDPSEIWVTITDCAGNSYSNTLSCLDGFVQPEISTFKYGETGYNIDIALISQKAFENCSLILSFYDEFGHLICTELKENITINIGNGTYTFSKSSDISSAATCKLFVWDNTEKLTSLDTSKKLNISSYINE